MLSLLSLQVAAGAEWFTPKNPSRIVDLGTTVTKVVTVKLPDLFEYPAGIGTDANLTEQGITITAVSDNESVFTVRNTDYYNYGKVHQLQLTQVANGKGEANVTVTLSKDGQSATATISYNYLSLIANDDYYGVNLTGPTKVDVLSNDRIMSGRLNDDYCSVSIIEEPKLGSCTIDTLHYDRFNSSYFRSAVVYTPAPAAINYSRDRLKYRVTLTDGTTSDATLDIVIRANPLVSRIIEFLPAPGQFTNSGGSFNDASCLIGQGSSSGTSSVPQADGLVSLGGFGGYVIVGFDQPVMNNPQNPYGVDFSIGGNSFVAAYKGVWTEPGAVMVSRDDNGNGIADDEWYELAGSDYWFSTSHRNIVMTYTDPAYNSRYTVPWVTDNGLAGALLTNQFHQQPYFPDPDIYPAAREKMTPDGKLSFNGTLIRSSLDKRVPSYIEFYRCPAFGYCDNKTNNADLTIAKNPYYDDDNGKSTNGFDISWAVDKKGNYVDLDHIDFIKIYTAGAVNAGWLGEWSTEVTGVGITTPDPDYVPQDYYLNYASITQLQVPVGASVQYEGMAFKNGRPIEEGEARWWVDDESVGTIDSDGVFTGKAIGNTVIHFQKYADAPADEFDVEVVAMSGVMIDIEGNASTVSNDSIACVKGETIYINVESLTQNKDQLNGTQSNRYIYDTYTWTNSDPEVGTIDNGTFKANLPGETLLTVSSDIDPSLSDTIKVTVLDIPETTLIASPIKIPHYNSAGTLTNGQIFTNGRNARVNMRSLLSEISPNFHLSGNTVEYDLSPLDFGSYPISITADAFGVSKTYNTSVLYDADNRRTPRQLLIVSGNSLVGVPLISSSERMLEKKLYTSSLPSGADASVITQGAYAWVAKGGKVTRWNVAKGESVASLPLESDGATELRIIADRLLAVTGAGNRAAFKTDLEPCSAAGIDPEAQVVSSAASQWTEGSDGNRVVELIDTVENVTYKVLPTAIYAYNADGKQIASVNLDVDAVTVMEATVDNATPVAKTTSGLTVYELATSASTATMARTVLFSDQESVFDIYTRLPEGADSWHQSSTRLANGNLQHKIQYTGTVEADSIVPVRVESIDNMGASAITTWPLKIAPRIYKPLPNAVEITGFNGDADFETSVPLTSLFLKNPAVSAYTEKNYLYDYSILGTSLPLGATAEINSEDGVLTVSAPQGQGGSGEVKLRCTTTYKNRPEYGAKVCDVTLPVTLDATSSIATITSGSLVVTPNPARDYIRISAESDAEVEIFTLSGLRVLAASCEQGAAIDVSTLPVGIYLVKATADGVTLTTKLIKQ